MIRTELIKPVAELLSRHAAERPDQPAFIDEHRTVTYRELAERTGRLAGHLADAGLRVGDRAAIYMHNSVATVESYLAITRAAGIGVCMNPGSSIREAGYMLADSDARILLTDRDHLDQARTLLEDRPGTSLVVIGSRSGPEVAGALDYEQLTTSEPSAAPRDRLGLDEPAWMLYTSGTTGRPKGVLLSQRNCLWVVAACWAPITGLSATDYVLSPLPLFHSYALDLCVLAVLAVGATERLLVRFSVADVLRWLAAEPVTFFPGVPTMFHYLLRQAGDTGLSTDRLRVCVSAGAIMPATLNEQFEQAFHVPLLDGYGITETATMVTMNWPIGTRVMGSCGLPLPGSAVRLVHPASGTDVPVGVDGEVWVQGPHVMIGYHNRPEASAEALAGGWYHTGDLGRRDPHGYLTITGRVKEMIVRGGENVYPAEVEEVLLADPSVLDAAVGGTPDDALGEVPVAFVVPRDPAAFDAGRLLAACRERLAAYKVPVAVRLVGQIPRTGSGKVQRFKLVASGTAGGGHDPAAASDGPSTSPVPG